MILACTRIGGTKPVVLLATVFLCVAFSSGLRAADTPEALPVTVKMQTDAPLAKIGEGTYRKFGFSVYRATLWTANGAWNPQKPYALQLRYTRDVSRDTLVDTVMDDVRDQGVADDDTLERWNKILVSVMPDVVEGDTITGLCLPGKKSLLFYNGKKIASIDDLAFSKAFFDVWLGDQADPDLREKLLGTHRNSRQ